MCSFFTVLDVVSETQVIWEPFQSGEHREGLGQAVILLLGTQRMSSDSVCQALVLMGNSNVSLIF